MDVGEPRRSGDLDTLSVVIGDIYDASLDRSVWPKALAGVSRFTDVYSTAIVRLNVSRAGAVLEEDNVIPPYYRDLYLNSLVKVDPFFVRKLFMEPGEILANTEMMAPDELWRTRLYREWAQPQGFVDGLNVTLERTASCVAHASMMMCRLSDEATKRRAGLLLPHLRRAVLIGGIVDLKHAEAATFEAALDGLNAGVFFVDGDARMKHVNAAGQAMLDNETALHAAGARLATHDRAADRTLQSALAAAAAGDAALGTGGVALPVPAKNGNLHVAHVLPLGAGERRRAGETFTSTAAVFVQPAAREHIEPPVALSRAFGLTIAETRVLVAIVDIGGVPDVADAFGLAQATIKVHLKSIYRKTGATRQADLVKLVARFASPLGTAPQGPNA